MTILSTRSTALCLFVSFVAAQLSAIPDCALGCAEATATKIGCSPFDAVCICADSSFAPSVIQCAGTTSCSPEVQAQLSDILQGICATASGSASGSVSTSRTVSASVSPPGSSTPAPSGSVTIVPPPISPSSAPSGSVTIVPPPISLSSAPPSSTSSIAPPSNSSAAPSSSPSTGSASRKLAPGAGAGMGAQLAATMIIVGLGMGTLCL
ncbi:hypothetical protein DFH08DRAFT_841191 [Mycena albidolilacea]|uniref:CFEM domain-containing protein n=1 Tax=Mycena albidolilacea TaxID=1033008 RepID=A0AAD7ALX3_9AGAR|nr:hypothetical protein DFH08DRAFT_841191 [Mycena albidolilacea]